jgi:NDP-sugar pyrophosphorylase family protein
VVLVGGEGLRLRPLTADVPKQALPVAEVPMLGRVLQHLGAHGITSVVLAVAYRPDVFYSLFPDDRSGDVSLSYAVEPTPLDTGGAIRFAAESAGIDDTFLVVNGDVLTDLDLGALVAFHRSAGGEATLSLTRVDDPSAYGSVVVGDGGRVLAFLEKPSPGEAAGDLVNAGTYVLEPSVLARIPSGRRVSVEREVFPGLVAEGSLRALAAPAYWLDMGTPARYLQAHLDLLSGRLAGPPAPGAQRQREGVWTLGEAVIDGDVEPPALVGDAAFVAAGSRVEWSVVGAGARVHENAQVRRSVLLPGSTVRPGAVVQDSIVGERAVVGEATVVQATTVVGTGVELEPGARLEGARVPAA